MVNKHIAAKFASIEHQLEILKASIEKKKASFKKGKGLKELKGILKGKGTFSEKEIEAVKAKFRETI